MSSSRIILGSLVAASIRHGIFTIALPWLILYRTAGMEEMRFASGFPFAGWMLMLLGAVLYIRAFGERLRMTAMVTASAGALGNDEQPPDSAADITSANTHEIPGDSPTNDTRPIWSEGVHAWSRNPLLLGVILILLGECLAFESLALLAFESLALLAYAVLYWAWLTLYLVIAEEPALRSTLGDDYTNYCSHVPRWFLRLRIRKTARSSH